MSFFKTLVRGSLLLNFKNQMFLVAAFSSCTVFIWIFQMWYPTGPIAWIIYLRRSFHYIQITICTFNTIIRTILRMLHGRPIQAFIMPRPMSRHDIFSPPFCFGVIYSFVVKVIKPHCPSSFRPIPVNSVYKPKCCGKKVTIFQVRNFRKQVLGKNKMHKDCC